MTHEHDAFGRTRLPRSSDRRGRVGLVLEVVDELLASPTTEARVFVASAFLGWLRNGGSLERDWLRVTGRPGSHLTPAALAAAAREERQAGDADAECSGSNDDTDAA